MKKRVDDEAILEELEEWTSISRYEIRHRLGEGGDGAAYLVRRKSASAADKLFVLKIPLDDEQSIANLEAETRLLLKLAHPNIVAVHDEGYLDEEKNVPVLLLAHGGINLTQYLRSEGRVEPGLAIAIVLQVCAGLAYAHEQGVIHRDVKPDNILVDRVGQIRIIDWGLAKGEHRSDKTAETKVKGTANYLAPEMIDCAKLDARTDIWQVGVLLYQLLTGDTPWVAKDGADKDRDAWKVELGLQIKSRPHRRIPPELVPSNVADVVDRCLAKKPHNRFQSMTEVIRALDAVRLVAPHIAAVEIGQHACAAEDSLTRNLKPTPEAITVPIHAEKRSSVKTSPVQFVEKSMMISDSMTFAPSEFRPLQKERDDNEDGSGHFAPQSRLRSGPVRDDDTQEFSFPRRRRRHVAVAAFALVIAAGAVIAWRASDSSTAATAARARPEAKQAAQVSSRLPDAPASLRAPLAAADTRTDSAEAAAPRTSPSSSGPAPTAAEDRPSGPRARPEEVKPVGALAELTVVVLPAGAFISLDGRTPVQSPFTFSDLRSGRHVIRVGLQRGNLTKEVRAKLKAGPNQVRIVLSDPFSSRSEDSALRVSPSPSTK